MAFPGWSTRGGSSTAFPSMKSFTIGSWQVTMARMSPLKMMPPLLIMAMRLLTRMAVCMSWVTTTDVMFSVRWRCRIRSMMRLMLMGSRPVVGSS